MDYVRVTDMRCARAGKLLGEWAGRLIWCFVRRVSRALGWEALVVARIPTTHIRACSWNEASSVKGSKMCLKIVICSWIGTSVTRGSPYSFLVGSLRVKCHSITIFLKRMLTVNSGWQRVELSEDQIGWKKPNKALDETETQGIASHHYPDCIASWTVVYVWAK